MSFCQKSKCSLFFSRKSYELSFSEIFCLILIRSFPGTFCCAEFVYKDTQISKIPLSVEFLAKIPPCFQMSRNKGGFWLNVPQKSFGRSKCCETRGVLAGILARNSTDMAGMGVLVCQLGATKRPRK